MSKSRDYVWQHVSFEESVKGGYDEGHYYNYCSYCLRRTEHQDSCCCECDSSNPDENYEPDDDEKYYDGDY